MKNLKKSTKVIIVLGGIVALALGILAISGLTAEASNNAWGYIQVQEFASNNAWG